MTTLNSTNLKDLVTAFKAAEDLQQLKLERVRAETQIDIDRYAGSLKASTKDGVIRYHAFKTKMWNSGERLDREIFPSIYKADPAGFVAESIYEDKLVFRSDDGSGDIGIAVPFDYFEDPQAWEDRFMDWAGEINAMVKNAPAILGDNLTYTPNTIGLEVFGKFFRLSGKYPPFTPKKKEAWLVEYATGNVYVLSVAEIEEGASPIANLKATPKDSSPADSNTGGTGIPLPPAGWV